MNEVIFKNVSESSKIELEKEIANTPVSSREIISKDLLSENFFQMIVTLGLAYVPVIVAWILKNRNKKGFEFHYKKKNFQGEYEEFDLKQIKDESSAKVELINLLESLIKSKE